MIKFYGTGSYFKANDKLGERFTKQNAIPVSLFKLIWLWLMNKWTGRRR